MTAAVHAACRELCAALGATEGSAHVPLVASLLRSVLPFRDYDARVTDEQSSLRAPWHAREPEGVCVKREPTDAPEIAPPPPPPRDVKPTAHLPSEPPLLRGQLEAATSIATLSAVESRMGDDTTATKTVDMSGGQWCTPDEVFVGARSLCEFFDRVYEVTAPHNGPVTQLARTFVALLLEPAALAVELAVARSDRALEQRELERLRRNASPTEDHARAVSAHIEHLTVNLFAGCPELALRVSDLPASGVRALFVLLAHGALVFGRESHDSALRTRLDAFRHNSALEEALGSRAALIWGVCRATLDQSDASHADAMRHTLLLALDAAQTRVAGMRQPYNASPANLATLREVQQLLRAADLPLPRARREHAPQRAELVI